MKSIDFVKIAKVVAKKLGQDFERVKIIKVNVDRDHDRDGDEILRIEIVVDGTLKGSEVASAARKLRPALEEIDGDLYPLLSFVSRVDYERGHKVREAH